MLYVYGLVGGDARVRGLRGFGRGPVRLVRAAGLTAAVSEVARTPAGAPAAFRRHDRVVRRLADLAPAVLPARFGSTTRDVPALADALAPRARALRRALALVRGREQMTLRVLVGTAAPDRVAHPRSGAAFLAARQRVLRVRELDPLRRAVAPLVGAERVERHPAAAVLTSVHHLIPRGRDTDYRAAVCRAAARLPALAIRVTGPWPPYAFAPDAVA